MTILKLRVGLKYWLRIWPQCELCFGFQVRFGFKVRFRVTVTGSHGNSMLTI